MGNLHSKSDHEVGVMKQTFFLSADLPITLSLTKTHILIELKGSG